MTLSSQHHSFDIKLAAIYGVECAILIHHFQHWVRINRFAKKNIKEGRCWTYQTRKEIQAHFPYFSFDEVRRLCEKLVNLGVLITGNFNKSVIDKTLWYAFVDEEMFQVDEKNSNNFYERQNCLSKGKIASSKGKIATCIPDTKTDTKPLEKENKKEKDETSADAESLSSYFLSKIKEKKTNFTKGVSPSWIKSSEKLLKVRTKKEIGQIIEFAINHEFWFSKCMAPDKILKHIDALELEMTKPKKAKESLISKLEENKKLVFEIESQFKNHYLFKDISIGSDYIEFNFGQSNRPYIKFTDSGFREQVINNLRKMNLTIEGL